MKFPIYILQLKLNEVNALLERLGNIEKKDPIIKLLLEQQIVINEAITILKNHKDGSKDLQRTGE